MKSLKLLTMGSLLFVTACSLDFPYSSFTGEKGDRWTSNQPIERVEENVPEQDQQDQVSVPPKKEEVLDERFLLESQFFNHLIEEEGQPVIGNPENVLALVNKKFALSSTYVPHDLTIPDVEFIFGDLDIEKAYLREVAAIAVEALFEASQNDNINLFAVSGYRSYERQNSIYRSEVREKGKEKAEKAVAIPGRSEHQTGLAIDVTSESAAFQLSQQFGETKEGKWLAQNAHRFGFIIRYPEGKEGITGYKFEPWHLRYVGVEIAKVLYENDLTLEEYFNKAKAI